MVSNDNRTFVEVDVGGITKTDTLATRILTALRINDGSRDISAQVYNRRDGRIHLSNSVNMPGLLNLVSSKADAQGTLKFLINTVKAAH